MQNISGNKKDGDGICILSFDSGGPGTYSQLLILKEYMNRMASDLQVSGDDVYPADYFDLMGGVGFGGLVALLLGHLRMNVNEAIDSLLDITSALFPEGSWDTIDVENNTKNLKNGIESILNTRSISLDTKMNEETSPPTRCKVALYAAASTHLSHPHAFRTYPSRGSNLNPTIVEAACATMVIPSHFSPVKIGPPRRQRSFVSGALGANNPTRLLLDEASTIFGKDRRVVQILSLGCGLPRVLSMESSSEKDDQKVLKEITADCELVAHELSARLFSIDAYLRLNVDRGMENVTMEDWNNLGAIESHTEAYIAKTAVSGALDSSMRYMKEGIAATTLGQLIHTGSVKSMAKAPPSVSPYFIPRTEPWDTMIHHLVHSSLSQQTIFPITGMGGCGKTQLVSYFLQQYPDLYNHVVYVDASSASSIKADLQTWARTLGDDHGRDTWEDALRILSSCSQDERWALVLDNADDPKLRLGPFLPKNPKITIIVTSRNRNLGNLSTTHHLELGEMSTQEALATLFKAARRQTPPSDAEMESALTLLNELGCLAVALVQAGTYCYQLSSTVGNVLQSYTFTQYLTLFYSHRAELMKKAEPSSLDDYERGAYTTLDLSYTALPQIPRDFLHLISFFHYADIPLEAFATAAKSSFQDPGVFLPRSEAHRQITLDLKRVLCIESQWSEIQVQETIHTLRSFSLLTATPMNDSVFLSLHPLVQSWCRDMDPAASMRYGEMAIQVLTTCGSDTNFQLNRYLFSHILHMLNQKEKRGFHVNDLMSFGVVLEQQGHYRTTEGLFHHALEVMKASVGSEASTTLIVCGWLGDLYIREGKWKEAEDLLIELLEHQRRILGMEHPDTIGTTGNLAITYTDQGRYEEAEKLQVEVLEQRRRVLGMEHPESITAAANLASIYTQRGSHDEAEELEVVVLEQSRRILGIEHPDTITAAGNLASTYDSQNKWNEAEQLRIQVLEQRRRILGMEHPSTILAMANLALTYGKLGRWEEDAALLAPAVQLCLKVLGREHPRTQSRIEWLIQAYDMLGKQREASEMKNLLL